MMKFKDVISERIKRGWVYLLCTFSYGWGIYTGTESILSGLLGLALWSFIFGVCLIIESLIRRD